jgi:peptidoglycan/LPS O-acetylase OafA/YrhL
MIKSDSRNLDVLRAFAVLCVFFSHIRQFVVHLPFQLYQMARFGVLIFFVHTCLVLLFSIERSSCGRARTALIFYVRRAFRIYPLSILTVLMMALLHIPRAPDVVYEWISPKQLLSNLTLTQNLTHVLSTPATLWSLPWEVQMYAVLPALFFLFGRRSVWMGLALWAASVLGARSLSQFVVLTFFPCFIGGLIAFQGLRSRIRYPLPAQLWPVALLAAAAFHALCWRTKEQELGGYITCLILGMLIPMFMELRESWFTRASHVVAKYSYGIYLAHMPVIWLAFVKLAGAPVLLRWTVLVVMSVGLPIALYHLLEAPMIKLGRQAAEAACRKAPLERRVAQAAGGL